MANVLLVDDEPDLLILLTDLVSQDLGHTVTATLDGQSAIFELEKKIPDLVITDERMPGIRGEEVIIRANELAPNIPSILLSGQHSGQAAKRLERYNTICLQKPVRLSELERIITGIMPTSP